MQATNSERRKIGCSDFSAEQLREAERSLDRTGSHAHFVKLSPEERREIDTLFA